MKQLALVLVLLSSGALAQDVDAPKYETLARMTVPVIQSDITDRPYRVIGTVEAKAGQLTRFSKRPSEEKLAAKLWAEARKLGADAVIRVDYGSVETTGWTYGQRRATGKAVKFIRQADAAIRD